MVYEFLIAHTEAIKFFTFLFNRKCSHISTIKDSRPVELPHRKLHVRISNPICFLPKASLYSVDGGCIPNK